jgi:assimilatory nitrate reductase catalytic subunit
MQHYQSGAQTRRIRTLHEAAPEPQAEIHPQLARRLRLDEGDRIVLTTARGQMRTAVRITSTLRTDCIFVPFHFSGAAAVNQLTFDGLDPISRMPEFKVCAVSAIGEHGLLEAL